LGDNRRALLISPASLADLCRHLNIINTLHTQRQLTTLLHLLLHVELVVDGNLPLIWSLQAQAEEFCRLYKQGRNKNLPKPAPSTPIDATQTMVYTPDGTSMVATSNQHDHDQDYSSLFENQLPVISASCPAVVCLVEKSKPELVTHLSSTTSPMSLTGGILLDQDYTEFWSIMPCHDKKLEASRPDFLQPSIDGDGDENNNNNNKTKTRKQKHLVDLVITTQECVELLQEWLGETKPTTGMEEGKASVDEVTTFLQQLPPSQVVYDELVSPTATLSTTANGNHEPTWATVSQSHTSTNSQSHQSINKNYTNDKDNDSKNNNDANASTINPYVSGGHADYIFTYAAKALFGVSLETVPWKPILAGSSNKSRIIKSARLAKRSKDSYQAVLYQLQDDGSYSTETPTTEMEKDNATPVLRFAMAYGMQTLQRVLDSATLLQHNLDYVEAMACPSGCINGGGQNKVQLEDAIANANTSRETPTQTRQRVGETQQQLQVVDDPLKKTTITSTTLPAAISSFKTTRYHVVPPMQYAMGAAAGVEVQELIW
jgi:iron only hydrogenase large subunit-like protein